MDLLGGYGSEDSSSSDNDSSPVDAGTTNTGVAPESIKQQGVETPQKITKKSKRLLRLNAVLPADVLERFTRSTVQAGRGGEKSGRDTYSSDSSESDTAAVTESKRLGRNTQKKLLTFDTIGTKDDGTGDTEISSLLSDLKGVAPTIAPPSNSITESKHEKLGMAFMNVTSSVVVERKKRSAGKKGVAPTIAPPSNSITESKHEKLGMAFLNVTSSVVVERKKRSAGKKPTINNRVKELNKEKRAKRKMIVEDVYSDEDREDESDSIEDSIPSTSMFKPVESDTRKFDKLPKPITESSILRPRMIASKVGRNAAPCVQSLSKERLTTSIATTTVEHDQLYRNDEAVTDLQKVEPTQPQRKKSKKDIEKALRRGDFSVIDEAKDITQTIYPNSYNAPSNEELLATSTSNNNAPSSFSTNNLQTYVPKEGGTSSSQSDKVSQKHRSKHQIHSLVLNAKNLEARRYRMGVMGGGVKKGSSSRVDGKKKYGW